MGGFTVDHYGNRIRVEIPPHSAGICHSDGRYSRGSITSRRTHLMPSYQMTPAEEAKYGFNLNIWQQIQLLQAWAPLIGFGQRFVQTVDPYQKALIIAEAAEWVASKTNAQADDQLVRLLADIAKTKEGEALIRWCLLQAEAAR